MQHSAQPQPAPEYRKKDFEKGQAFFEALALKGAIECFERSVEARRKVSASYAMIAKCYKKLGKLNQVRRYTQLAKEAAEREAAAARKAY